MNRANRRAFLTCCGVAPIAGAGLLGLAARRASAQAKEILPKHVTPEALKAVTKGLDYLGTQQTEDGSWSTAGGQAYPVAMTGLAGTGDMREVLARAAAGDPRAVLGREINEAAEVEAKYR